MLREYMAIIRRNGAALLRLVSEILDLSKSEMNTLALQYEQSDVLSRLHYMVGSLHSLAHAKGVRLSVESPETNMVMDFDPERLSQIVHNLLSNAIKFTPAGGKIVLNALIVTRQDHEYLMIQVSDTGVGIAPEDLPHIFDRYYQAKNQHYADRGGSGIGLSFTSELVKLMGGTITVKSALERGTTFTVLLPVRRSAPLKQPVVAQHEARASLIDHKNSSKQQAPAHHPTLLLIEDNPDVMAYLNVCLKDSYLLYQAYNGQDGVTLAFETAPDLILSDVMMPVMDGFEVCQVLKTDHRTSHVPVVLLTAKATVEDRIAGLQRGADAYLAKPFNRTELLLQLDNLLKLRQRIQSRYVSVDFPDPASDPDLEMEDKFLKRFREFIESQIDNTALSVDDLCRAAGMGRTNLHQKITSLTGKSVMQYVRALRLHKARQLLENTELNVSEIAFEVGFDDPKYFSRVFTEEMGMPPTRWREKKS
jgi:DNA-binding response OmpR family regulator/two-component sensor histidine kinase